MKIQVPDHMRNKWEKNNTQSPTNTIEYVKDMMNWIFDSMKSEGSWIKIFDKALSEEEIKRLYQWKNVL